MKRILRSKLFAAASMGLGVFAFAGSTPAMSTSVDFASNTAANGVASFRGHAIYDDVSHVLTLVVENTTAAAKGGYLTGVAFNAGNTQGVYQDGDNKVTPKVDEDAFDNARSKKSLIKVKKIGNYASGTALDGKFGKANRKSAVRGVRTGDSHSFSFILSGAGASGLTAGDLFGGQGGLVASFGAINGKKIDIVTGKLVPAQLIDNTNTGGTTTTDNSAQGGTGTTTDTSGNSNTGTGTNGRPVVPGVVVVPNTNGGGSNNTGNHSIPSGNVLPSVVVDTGTDNLPGTGGSSGSGQVTAVPLPPAAWSGLAGLFAVGLGKVRRRLKA